MTPTASWTFLLLAGYAVSIGLATSLAAYCFLQRSTRVADAFGACMVAVLLWSVGASGRLLAPTETIWYAWTLVMYLGVVSAAVLLFVFAVRYTGRGPNLNARRVALLFVVPATSMVLLATDPSHDLFFAGVSEVPFGVSTVFSADSGPWFWVNALYSYVLFGGATALLAQFAVSNHRVYRRQALLVLGGASVPWAFNVAYVFTLGPAFPVDPTPVGFAVGSGLLAYAVFRLDLADLTPVARSAVVDAIDDAVFVLDEDGRLVDLNPAAESLLAGLPDGRPEDPVGQPLEAVAPASLLAADGSPEAVTVEGSERWYSARELPLDEGGSVLVASDVTDGVRRQRQLREQTERLEEFTRVAAHDLRNPLNAITGYVELARETGDVSNLEPVPPAADRVETLVDDLLTLGREGRVVEETDPVSLERAARSAWGKVETGGATLEVVDDALVGADEARFTKLLENLFRNTAEHGSTSPRSHAPEDTVEHGTADTRQSGTTAERSDVAVTVGPLPDGFFVADDGTGIPTERRADVFEYGYSTHGGTGLGLPVVRSIAVAHGWEVSVTEAAGGGARFEFTGARVRAPPALADAIGFDDLETTRATEGTTATERSDAGETADAVDADGAPDRSS